MLLPQLLRVGVVYAVVAVAFFTLSCPLLEGRGYGVHGGFGAVVVMVMVLVLAVGVGQF